MAQQPIIRPKVKKNVYAADTLLVVVNIQNADFSGIARLVQILPEGFTFAKGDDFNASVFQSNDTLKFIWDYLPKMRRMGITYHLIPDTILSGKFEVCQGQFDYMDGKRSKTIPIKYKKIFVLPFIEPEPEPEPEEQEVVLTDSARKYQQDSLMNLQFTASLHYTLLLFSADNPVEIVNVDPNLKITEPIRPLYYQNKYYYLIGEFVDQQAAVVRQNELMQNSQMLIEVVKMQDRIPYFIERSENQFPTNE